MENEKNFNGKTLDSLVKDKNVSDFYQMFSKYMPLLSQNRNSSRYMKRKEIPKKLEEFKTGRGSITNEDLKTLFNKTLFLSIPSNLMNDTELMDYFVELVSESEKSNFEEFCELYDQYKKGYLTKEFEDYKSEVQIRFANESPARLFQDFINRSSDEVKNELFLNLFEGNPNDILQYSFPTEIYQRNEKLVSDCISMQLREKAEMLEILGTQETLRRCSDNVFEKVPDKVKYDHIEQFTKEELKIIKSEKVTWKEIEDVLSGEELMEILDSGYFEPEEGQTFHLTFKSAYPDVSKLIEVAKKYKLTCSLTVESCADLSIGALQVLDKVGIVVDTVRFKKDDLGEMQQELYNIKDYKKCLNVIDIMTKDVEEVAGVKPNDPDRDKKVAGLLLKRLSHLTRYNDDYYERLKLNKDLEFEKLLVNANLIGPLLLGECFCSGYAEAVRNLFLCSNIKETRYVSAYNKDSQKFGHAWNQAKLDGEWKNIDVTRDADRIVAMKEPKYIFKSDDDFGHDEYAPNRRTEKCKKSIKDVTKYMHYRKIEPNKNFKLLVAYGVKDCKLCYSEVANYEKERRIAQKNLSK